MTGSGTSYRFPHKRMTTESYSSACSFTDKALVKSFKLSIFVSVTKFSLTIVNQPINITSLRRKLELPLFSFSLRVGRFNQLSSECVAYFTTMGKHRGLLKVTQADDTGFEQNMEHKIYLNRLSI